MGFLRCHDLVYVHYNALLIYQLHNSHGCDNFGLGQTYLRVMNRKFDLEFVPFPPS